LKNLTLCIFANVSRGDKVDRCLVFNLNCLSTVAEGSATISSRHVSRVNAAGEIVPLERVGLRIAAAHIAKRFGLCDEGRSLAVRP
jgi:hypothetical protein